MSKSGEGGGLEIWRLMAIEVRTLGRPERGFELCLSPEESSRIPESVLGHPSSMWAEGAGPFLLRHVPWSRLHQTPAKPGPWC